MTAAIDTSTNSSFSSKLPGLQTAVDSTSLGELKICPRRYQYSIVLGYQPRTESVHLTFGILLHSATERYHHARAARQSHEDSLESSLMWALRETWNKELNRPWLSDRPAKNRFTLIRTLVWYLDEFGAADPLQTVVLANGKPAVELSFQFDSGVTTQVTCERVTICGHIDRIATLNSVPYIVDLKSTEHTIDAGFFAKYSPDNQFSTYMLAGRVAFDVPVKGLIVDGVQVAVGFSRFARGLVSRDDSQIEEWLADTKIWLGQMEDYAIEQYWPQNDKSCGLYGGCQFRGVCARSPAARQQWLDADFKKRIWDPRQRRGDI